MLSGRYKYDGVSIVDLSKTQLVMKRQVENKIRTGLYGVEDVPCCICEGTDFELLAEKDRHGLYMPVKTCRQCGLIQINPRMTQKAYTEFYQVEYRRLYEDFNPSNLFKDEYINGRRVFNYLEQRLNKRLSGLMVLEVGCAAGGLLQYFKEKGNEVAGVDVSDEGPEFGRKRGLNLCAGTLSDFRLERPPDLVIYSDVFEHLLDPLKELKLLSSVIGENSLIYIAVPGVKYLEASYNGDFLLMLQNAHTYYFTQTTLESLFRKAGFTLVSSSECVEAVFKKSIETEASHDFIPDFAAVMTYLSRMERRRSSWRPSPFAVGRVTRASLVFILRSLRLYRAARSFYQRFKRSQASA